MTKREKLKPVPRVIEELLKIANEGFEDSEETDPNEAEFKKRAELLKNIDESLKQGNPPTSLEETWKEIMGDRQKDFTYGMLMMTIRDPITGKRRRIDILSNEQQTVRRYLEGIAKLGEEYDPDFGKMPEPVELSEAPVRVELDWQGRVRFVQSDLLKKLTDVEAFRIKLCPICYKFFWAGRRDMKGCSKKCAQNIRTRKSRSKNKNKK